jgi:hypothetical protein
MYKTIEELWAAAERIGKPTAFVCAATCVMAGFALASFIRDYGIDWRENKIKQLEVKVQELDRENHEFRKKLAGNETELNQLRSLQARLLEQEGIWSSDRFDAELAKVRTLGWGKSVELLGERYSFRVISGDRVNTCSFALTRLSDGQKQEALLNKGEIGTLVEILGRKVRVKLESLPGTAPWQQSECRFALRSQKGD